jgi:hypothetical protein
MRLCTPVPLCLAAAAVSFPVPAYAEAPARAPAPACAAPDAGAFPLTTRLHGGPRSYRAGGGYGTWYLDLTNTTDGTCTGIHPVVVLVDTARVLKASQPHLDFYADGRPHAVRFERTDEDELVGALTEGATDSADARDPFPGFTVGPGKTVTVKLRLGLTSDTAPGAITVNAAVVQRHGDDGDWVGQSNDYRFAVEKDEEEPRPTAATPATPGTRHPDDDPQASPSPGDSPSLAEAAEELAGTGLASALRLLAVAVCLLGAGTALVLVRRRK